MAVKLHLGCGDVILPGWVNLDAEAGPQVDVVDDAATLASIPRESVDVIYASHLLDHFGRHEVDAVLRTWASRLVPGGILRVAVSDFAAAVAEYQNGRPLSELLGLLVGGHKSPFDRHGMLFDYSTLASALTRAGLVHVEPYDWRGTEHSGHDDFAQAYLPHLARERGRLMSLNVEARRSPVPSCAWDGVEYAVLGDSHAWVFTQAHGHPGWFAQQRFVRSLDGRFAVNYLGPWLAWGFGDLTRRAAVEQALRTVPAAVGVILSFGEIDCRCHVVPQAQRRRTSVREVCRDVAGRYLMLVQQLAEAGRRVLLWHVPPPTGGACYNPEFPSNGSYDERRAATEALNDELVRGVRARGWGFLDIYAHLVHGGRTQTSCFRDQIHLDPRRVWPWIEQELNRWQSEH